MHAKSVYSKLHNDSEENTPPVTSCGFGMKPEKYYSSDVI